MSRLAQFALAALFMILMPATTAAQAPGLSSHEACMLKSVSKAALSPDARYVAYEAIIPLDPRIEDGGARHELHLKSDMGGKSIDRVFLTGSFSSWRWDKKSRGIYFAAKRGDDKSTAIYHLPVDGGEARRIFEPVGSLRDWDVCYADACVLYTATVAKPKSPHVAKGYDQFLFDTDHAEVALRLGSFADGSDERIELKGAPSHPKFAPNDKLATFFLAPTSSVDDSYMHRKLQILDVQSLETKLLHANPGKVGDVAWNMKSTHVAYVSAIDVHDPKESTLMVTAVADGATKILTPPDFEGHIAEPTFLHFPGMSAEYEDRIYFLVYRGTISEVMFQDMKGGEMQHPAKTTDVEGMDEDPVIWRSLDIGFQERGPTSSFRFVSVADSARHPNELYINGLRSTRSNPDTIDRHKHRALCKQETIRYTARDGLEIEGVLIWPTNYMPGERYPLICMIHGGPEAHYSDGWLTAYSMPGQVAAAKGYFVFHPNYRSSTGRGVAFSKAGQGRSSHEEFDDIVDGVDYLIEKKLVDPKRVGITGGSYGGYASAWGATYYSDRFAASVMFVGISEQLSKIFTTDIPDESFLVHWRMRPFGNWMKYLEASPIYYVERSKTPILIMHGEQDPRVPVAQSIELYRALKMKGDVPVRLVLYPREQHGNRNAAARFDYSLRMMRWFDSYLSGEGEMPPEDVDYGIKD